jgi:hypothetical protein
MRPCARISKKAGLSRHCSAVYFVHACSLKPVCCCRCVRGAQCTYKHEMLPRASGAGAPQSAKAGPGVDAAAKLPKVVPSTLMNVVVFSQEDIELFNGNLPKSGKVCDLKDKLHSDPRCVDLFYKHRETKEWTRLLSSEDCELLYLRTNIAHPRKDSVLHVRAQIREVWRSQAFIGLFADPFVVRVLAQFNSFRLLRACVHLNSYPFVSSQNNSLKNTAVQT